MEVYFDRNKSGEISGSSKDSPKIIFIDGYRPTMKDSWRSALPADGETWLCTVVRDTQPDSRRKGALLVRLVKRIQKEFRIVEVPSLFEEAPQLKIKAFLGSNEVSYSPEEVPEVIRARVSAREAEIKQKEETLLAECLASVGKYYTGYITVKNMKGYCTSFVEKEKVVQTFSFGNSSIRVEFELPPCFKYDYYAVEVIDLAEAERQFGEAKIGTDRLYWSVQFPGFSPRVVIKNPPADEVESAVRINKNEVFLNRTWGDITVSDRVGVVEHTDGRVYYPAKIWSNEKIVLQNKRIVEEIKSTIRPFEERVHAILGHEIEAYMGRISQALANIYDICTTERPVIVDSYRTEREHIPESDDGYRSAGWITVNRRYTGLRLNSGDLLLNLASGGRYNDNNVQVLRVALIECYKKDLEDNIIELKKSLQKVFEEAVEDRNDAVQFYEPLTAVEMPAMVQETFDRIQCMKDNVFALIEGCLERDVPEKVRERCLVLRETLVQKNQEAEHLEYEANRLRAPYSSSFYLNLYNFDKELESDPWHLEASLFKITKEFASFKANKLAAIEEAKQKRAEWESSVKEGTILKISSEDPPVSNSEEERVEETEVLNTRNWMDLAVSEAYQIAKQVHPSVSVDALLSALGYGAKKRDRALSAFFGTSDLRVLNPRADSQLVRIIVEEVIEMIRKNRDEIEKGLGLGEVKKAEPATPASLDALREKFGKKR